LIPGHRSERGPCGLCCWGRDWCATAFAKLRAGCCRSAALCTFVFVHVFHLCRLCSGRKRCATAFAKLRAGCCRSAALCTLIFVQIFHLLLKPLESHPFNLFLRFCTIALRGLVCYERYPVSIDADSGFNFSALCRGRIKKREIHD